jgi:hypothetical protein
VNQDSTDIRLFQSWKHKGDPFAKYDYMNALPVLSHLEGFLSLCDGLRKQGVKLPQSYLKNESRAFLAIRNNQYVTTRYRWMDAPTDCWNTSADTWWGDFLKQKEQWESYEVV